MPSVPVSGDGAAWADAGGACATPVNNQVTADVGCLQIGAGQHLALTTSSVASTSWTISSQCVDLQLSCCFMGPAPVCRSYVPASHWIMSSTLQSEGHQLVQAAGRGTTPDLLRMLTCLERQQGLQGDRFGGSLTAKQIALSGPRALQPD